MTKSTKRYTFQAKSWIVVLGVFIVSFAMSSAFFTTSDRIGESFTYPGPVHHIGRVAGAATDMIDEELEESGIASITIHQNERPRAYSYVIEEPLSVYNFLRLAQQQRAFIVEYGTDESGTQGITLIDTIQPDGTFWDVRVDGEYVGSLDEVLVYPGSSVLLEQ